MKPSSYYVVLCILGVVAPWIFITDFLGLPQASVPLFFTSIFATPMASAVAADLMVCSIVFFFFVFLEGRRLGMKNVWLFVPATLFVGLSFGLPLFLYQRSKRLEQGA